MSDVIPYENLTDGEMALVFARYVSTVAIRGGFTFSREFMVAELERMAEWLREKEEVYESMNGGRQL